MIFSKITALLFHCLPPVMVSFQLNRLYLTTLEMTIEK